MKNATFLEVMEALANKFDSDCVEVTFEREGITVEGGDDDPQGRENAFTLRRYEATFERDDDDNIVNNPIQEILDAIDADNDKPCACRCNGGT